MMSAIAVAAARRSDCWRAHILPNMAAMRALAFIVRFINDILLSAPSIVIGLFIYEIVVVTYAGLLRLWAGAAP